MGDSSIRLVVFGYRGYNIVHCQSLYYGWPWSAGEFSLAGYSTVPAATVGTSIMMVKDLIDLKLGPPTPEAENMHDWMAEQQIEAIISENKIGEIPDNIRLAVFGYRGYNIVHCKRLYFGWPWPAGEFSWDKYLSRAFLNAVAGSSIVNAKKLIDARLGPPAAGEENQHDWTTLQQNEDANSVLLQKMNSPGRTPKAERFLLIKQWGFGLWSDMADLQVKLLLAEITNRHPVIFWGKDSLYSVSGYFNSFEQYFLPVSSYSISDVVNEEYSYYPPIWNSFNVFLTDPQKMSMAYRDIASFISSDANVLVSDVSNFMYDMLPWVKKGHPLYGPVDGMDELYHTSTETLPVLNAYRYIANKYLKLQPDIANEIDQFYHAYMENGPVVAVHIRAGIKRTNNQRWKELIMQCHPVEIDKFLKANPSARVFLLTDDAAILSQFKQLYGNILIYTDCNRETNYDTELCLNVFPDQRRKGIEILKDTYLACKCDYFIGNTGSNVSQAVGRLKAWKKDQVKLLNL